MNTKSDKEELKDAASKLVSSFVDALFQTNQLRTGLGVLLGAFLAVAAHVAEELQWIKLSQIAFYEYIIIGLFIIHLPLVLTYLFKFKPTSDQADIAFAVIEKAKKAGVKKQVIDEMYLETAKAVLKNVVLNDETKKEIEAGSKQSKPLPVSEAEKRAT